MNVTFEDRQHIVDYIPRNGGKIDLKYYDHISTTCLRKYKTFLCLISGLNIDIMNIILKMLYQLENEQNRTWIICYYFEPNNYPISYIRKCYNISHNITEISKYDLCEKYNMYDYRRQKHKSVPFWMILQFIRYHGLKDNKGCTRKLLYVYIYQPGEGPY